MPEPQRCQMCGAEPARMYMQGWFCAGHTPAALAGHEENRPDPERTLEALKRRDVPRAPVRAYGRATSIPHRDKRGRIIE